MENSVNRASQTLQCQGAEIFLYRLPRKKAGHNKRGEDMEKEGCLRGKAKLSSIRTDCLAG